MAKISKSFVITLKRKAGPCRGSLSKKIANFVTSTKKYIFPSEYIYLIENFDDYFDGNFDGNFDENFIGILMGIRLG